MSHDVDGTGAIIAPYVLALDHVGGHIRRHRHDDQAGRITLGLRASGTVVDREAQLRGRRVGQDDIDAVGTQGVADRGAEQARAAQEKSASSSRLRSPPERLLTGELARAGAKRKSPR